IALDQIGPVLNHLDRCHLDALPQCRCYRDNLPQTALCIAESTSTRRCLAKIMQQLVWPTIRHFQSGFAPRLSPAGYLRTTPAIRLQTESSAAATRRSLGPYYQHSGEVR